MKMPALRTISNFSDSQVPISQPTRNAPSTANAVLSTPTLATAADTDRFAVVHAAAVALAAVTAAAPAVCHAVISAGIRR
jgi:hypothetical protein